MFIDFMDTPLGILKIQASQNGVTHVIFCEEKVDAVTTNRITEKCKKQLTEYFSGVRITFDLPLEASGTAFQKKIWDALLTIKAGKTASYLDIAVMISNPKAVRAVGAANGKNPIGIIVPCHRVIGSDGTLTGYAGGLDRKAWLLKHEGCDVSATQRKSVQQAEMFS